MRSRLKSPRIGWDDESPDRHQCAGVGGSLIDALTTVVEVDVHVDFPRDQKDAKFLACALATDVEFFVTGDRDFAQAYKLVNTTILSVSLFKKFLMQAE